MKKKDRNRVILLIVVGVLVLSMVLALVIPASYAEGARESIIAGDRIRNITNLICPVGMMG